METIIQILSRELDRPAQHVENIITLLDEGNTVPFIARYRKELHGAMDDQLIRQLADRLQYLRNLQDRRDEVKQAIENQGKLTDELAAAIDSAATLAEVGTFTGPISRSDVPGRPLPGKRDWSPLPCWPLSRARRWTWRGRRWSILTQKRGWRPPRMPSRGPPTSSPS